MPETLVTLGLSFSAEKTESQVSSLITKFDELAERTGNIQGAFDRLFGGGLAAGISQVTQALGRFNSGLTFSNNLAQNVSQSLQLIPTAITAVNKTRIDPISPSAVSNIQAASRGIDTAASAVSTLSGALDAMNSKLQLAVTAGNSAAAAVNQISIDPSVQNVQSLRVINGELEQTAEHGNAVADGLARAFGATAVLNYMKKATAKAVEFGQELASIQTLAHNFDLSVVSKGLLGMPSVLGDAAQNANTLYWAYSSGVEGSEKDLLDFTKVVAQTSAVIRSDVVPTVDAMTSVMNAYGLAARDAAELSDLFFTIVNYGKASGKQLVNELGQVIPTAATAGLTLDEMGAAVASLTRTMQPRDAITHFNNMLSKMIKPTKASQLAAQQLGIELGLSAIRAKGFSNVMEEIREKTKGNQEALLQLFPDLRGQRAALQFLNKGWDDYQKQLDNFANKAGSSSKAMEILNNDINVQLGVLPVTLGKISQQAGAMVTKILTLGGALAPVIYGFNNMSDGAQKFLAAITLATRAINLYKSVAAALNNVKAMMIRSNNIINAQNTREQAQRAGAAAGLAKEAAAATAAAKTIIDLRRQELELAALKAKADLTEAQSARAAGVARQAEIKERRALNALRKQEAVVGRLKNAGLADTPNYQIQSAELKSLAAAHEQANLATLKAMDTFEKSNLVAYDTARAYKSAELAAVENAAAQLINGKYNLASASVAQKLNMTAAAGTASLKSNTAAVMENITAKTAMSTIDVAAVTTSNAMAATRIKDAAAMAAELGRLAEISAAKANSIAEEYLQAESIGDTNRMMVLSEKLKIADANAEKLRQQHLIATNALLAQNNAQKKINNALIKEGLAYDAANTIAGVAKTGVGFKGGFKATFDTVGFMAAMKYTGTGMKAGAAGARSLRAALTGLGATFGKIAGAIFSFKTLLLAGVFAAFDGIQSFIRTGSFLKGSVTQALADKLVDWMTGATKRLGKFEADAARLLELKAARKALDSFAKDIEKEFTQTFYEEFSLKEMPVPDQLRHYGEEYNKAVALYAEKYNFKALKDAENRAKKALDTRAELDNKIARMDAKGDEVSEYQRKELERLEKLQADAEKELHEINQGAIKVRDAMKDYGSRIRDINQEQREALKSIEDIINKQNFKMMTPEEQLDETQIAFRNNLMNYYKAFDGKNYAVAQEILESLVGNYNTLRDDAINRLKQNESALEAIAKANQDIALKYAKSDQERLSILGNQAQEYLKAYEEQMKAGSPAEALESFQKAFSVEEQRRAIMEKMAEAELRANESTVKLIQSMDKFKSSAMSAVNANSTEAVRLQARRFDPLPAFTPVATRQEQYDGLAAQMKTWSDAHMEALKNALIESNQAINEEKAEYDKDWEKVVEGNMATMDRLEAGINKLTSVLSRGIGINPKDLTALSN